MLVTTNVFIRAETDTYFFETRTWQLFNACTANFM